MCAVMWGGWVSNRWVRGEWDDGGVSFLLDSPATGLAPAPLGPCEGTHRHIKTHTRMPPKQVFLYMKQMVKSSFRFC